MKKLLSILLVVSLSLSSALVGSANKEDVSSAQKPREGDSIILYEYDMKELDTEFTMELFNETFSKEEIKVALSVEKASKVEATYEFRSYEVTEEEIDTFYAELEENVARGAALNYYFSNVYWRCRYSSAEGQYLLTLTMVPTSVIPGNMTTSMASTIWTLVKTEMANSSYWRSETSLRQQFDCHALGVMYLGDIGTWDLEPDRPTSGAYQYVTNSCNVDITGSIGSECASLNGKKGCAVTK